MLRAVYGEAVMMKFQWHKRLKEGGEGFKCGKDTQLEASDRRLSIQDIVRKIQTEDLEMRLIFAEVVS